MPQRTILARIFFLVWNSVQADDRLDSAQTTATTPVEQAVQQQEQAGEAAANAASQPKVSENAAVKRARTEQNNVQESIGNAQDLFQGDHN